MSEHLEGHLDTIPQLSLPTATASPTLLLPNTGTPPPGPGGSRRRRGTASRGTQRAKSPTLGVGSPTVCQIKVIAKDASLRLTTRLSRTAHTPTGTFSPQRLSGVAVAPEQVSGIKSVTQQC